MWSRCEALSLHRNSALASQDCFYLQKAGYFFWCKSYLAVFLCTIIRVLTTSTGLLAMQAESPAKKLKMIIRRGKSSKSLRHWRWVQKSRKAHLAAKWQPAPSLTPCASNWAFEASYTGSCNNNVNTPTRRAPPRRVTNQHKMRTTLKTWTPATRAARCAVGSPPRHKPRTPSCLREQFPSHQSSCQWQKSTDVTVFNLVYIRDIQQPVDDFPHREEGPRYLCSLVAAPTLHSHLNLKKYRNITVITILLAIMLMYN